MIVSPHLGCIFKYYVHKYWLNSKFLSEILFVNYAWMLGQPLCIQKNDWHPITLITDWHIFDIRLYYGRWIFFFNIDTSLGQFETGLHGVWTDLNCSQCTRNYNIWEAFPQLSSCQLLKLGVNTLPQVSLMKLLWFLLIKLLKSYLYSINLELTDL